MAKYIQLPVTLFFDIIDAIDTIPDSDKTPELRLCEIELLEKMGRMERRIKYAQEVKKRGFEE